jgi:hypothetical protein
VPHLDLRTAFGSERSFCRATAWWRTSDRADGVEIVRVTEDPCGRGLGFDVVRVPVGSDTVTDRVDRFGSDGSIRQELPRLASAEAVKDQPFDNA